MSTIQFSGISEKKNRIYTKNSKKSHEIVPEYAYRSIEDSKHKTEGTALGKHFRNRGKSTKDFFKKKVNFTVKILKLPRTSDGSLIFPED